MLECRTRCNFGTTQKLHTQNRCRSIAVMLQLILGILLEENGGARSRTHYLGEMALQRRKSRLFVLILFCSTPSLTFYLLPVHDKNMKYECECESSCANLPKQISSGSTSIRIRDLSRQNISYTVLYQQNLHQNSTVSCIIQLSTSARHLYPVLVA